MSGPDDLWKDVDIRVIDQRIGAGIGGFDTVIRAYHRPTDRPTDRPTGILVEVPRLSGSQFYDREIAMDMIRSALTHPEYRGDA